MNTKPLPMPHRGQKQRLAALCVGAAMTLFAGLCLAQAQPAPVAPKVLAQAAPDASAAPEWTQLSPAQQAALRPLAGSWAGMPAAQKRKWIKISENFAANPPAEKERLHSNMSEWAALTPQQRTQARLNFAETRALTDGLTPEQRQTQWQAYQLLSPEEKKKLAASSRGLPSGAAVAVRPADPINSSPPPQFGTGQALSRLQANPVQQRRIAVPMAPASAPGAAQKLRP
jgi:Protein of unknown function (DUF3106)